VSVTSRAWVGAAGVLGLALSSLACGRGGEGAMAALPPSSGWSEGILADRAAKDRDLRVDPDTPLRKEDVATFHGLEYWPPDPAYRFAGAIDVYDAPRRFTIVTTTGKERPCERYGQVAFEVRGKRCVLQVYRLLDATPEPGGAGFFVPFQDETTGKETYAAGRYVELDGPDGGPYVLDFNRAYNPSCAYGDPERFRCPVTPAENRLAVRIEAGERGYVPHGR
jgi:uncharacterized protein (DUF1684 family)